MHTQRAKLPSHAARRYFCAFMLDFLLLLYISRGGASFWVYGPAFLLRLFAFHRQYASFHQEIRCFFYAAMA